MRAISKTVLMLSLMAPLLTGCASTSADSFCFAAKPIYLNDDEYLNDGNARKLKALDFTALNTADGTVPLSMPLSAEKAARWIGMKTLNMRRLTADKKLEQSTG